MMLASRRSGYFTLFIDFTVNVDVTFSTAELKGRTEENCKGSFCHAPTDNISCFLFFSSPVLFFFCTGTPCYCPRLSARSALIQDRLYIYIYIYIYIKY